MKRPSGLLIYLACFTLSIACGKLSPSQASERARGYLEQAGSIYSTIADTAGKDGKNQTDSLAYGQKADDKIAMRLIFAFMVAVDAKGCADARMTLLNFEAQEKLQEKPTAEEYDKLVQALAELSKSADNFVTNPKITDATPAVERLELRKAQSLIKQAYDLVVGNRPAQ